MLEELITHSEASHKNHKPQSQKKKNKFKKKRNKEKEVREEKSWGVNTDGVYKKNDER